MTRAGIAMTFTASRKDANSFSAVSKFRFHKGPVGHSDGDALAHAICDALLGAAGLGDIGTHFSGHRSEMKDVSSLQFLEASSRTAGLNSGSALRISMRL